MATKWKDYELTEAPKWTNYTPTTAPTWTNYTPTTAPTWTDFAPSKDFEWKDETKYNKYITDYENRPDFSYDLNGDALYQQYKDKYIKQGKMAMADTMGQASAMTGGYGSSYASTAGNQAYQASLENLNNIVPELYQMAYDRYNQDGQDMLNMISLLGNERAFEYGKWGDEVEIEKSNHQGDYDHKMSVWETENNIGLQNHNGEYNHNMSVWETENDIGLQNHNGEYNHDMSVWETENNVGLTNHTNSYNDKVNEESNTTNKNPNYLSDTAKIQEWSDAILSAGTESEALRYVERLEQLDPDLADSLYEQWLDEHSDLDKKDTTVIHKGKNGGAGKFAIHVLN